jgi:hypothetical protein
MMAEETLGLESAAKRLHEFPSEGEEHTKILRAYARFHRVLGVLLSALVGEGQTVWLTERKEHLLFLDTDEAPMRNVYGKALYLVPGLEPYQKAFAEVALAQRDALDLIKQSEVPPGLLMPVVRQDVVQVKLSRHVNFISQTRTPEGIVNDMQERLETKKLILKRDFEPYRNLAGDSRLAALEREIENLSTSLATVKASQAQRFRKRSKQERLMAMVYQHTPDGISTENVYVREVGLVLVGANVSVVFPAGLRKERSDKVKLEPLVRYDNVLVYDEALWDAAKGSGETGKGEMVL